MLWHGSTESHVGFHHAGLPHPTLGSTGTNVRVSGGWAAARPLQKSPGRWNGRPLCQNQKCPLSKPPKYPKTEQECSCSLRCSVRFAEGMDYSWVLNQTFKCLHIVPCCLIPQVFFSWNSWNDVLNDRWTKLYGILHILLLWKMIHF